MKMRNSIFLSSLIFLFFSLAFSCYAFNLGTARVYFLKGDYASVINECENILAAAGSSSQLEELYYILALSYMKQGNLLRASDIFEIILKEFKNSKFQEKALMGLGDVYFLKSDYDSAKN